MPRAAGAKLIFDGDVIKKIVSDPRVTWKSKYLTRKMSAIQWLNSEANKQGFTGFTAEPFYDNAWQAIWEQGTLPITYQRLAQDQKDKVNIYLTIANELALDALQINSAGVPMSQVIAKKKADFIFKRSGLRAWIISKTGDKVRIRMENGSLSDLISLDSIKNDIRPI